MKSFIFIFLLGLLPIWSNPSKELELFFLKPDTIRIESVENKKFLTLYDVFRKSKTFHPFFETFGEDKEYSLIFEGENCKNSRIKSFAIIYRISQIGGGETIVFVNKTLWVPLCPDTDKKTKMELSSLFGSALIDANLSLIAIANENNLPLPPKHNKEIFKEYQRENRNLIAKYYRSTILKGLKEIIPQLYSKKELKKLKKPLYLENTFLKKFCWKDFYENLSWIGLEKTQQFKEAIQNNPKRWDIFKAYEERIKHFEE